jgi:hypothetical protein
MAHVNTPSKLVDAFADHFLPELLKTEDFDAFEELVSCDMRNIAAKAMALCLERFDAMLLESIPRGWSVHEHARRTLVTLLGEVSWTRTIFLDKHGRRRAWSDELLGIPKRARVSANAFLWICACAAYNSYRRTARAFEAMSGCLISHVAVMRFVHEEGRLLKEAPPTGAHLSQDTIFTEVDGLWIHLQSDEHRKEALPRGVYEQAKKTASFELKMACIYAGKHKDGTGRVHRGNLSVIAADADPDEFWRRAWGQVCADYELGDLEHVWLGADGGSWCGPEHLEQVAPDSCSIEHSLDPFHVMQGICRAFPEGAKRDWAQSLAFRRKPGQLVRMCERIADHMRPGKQRDKVKELGKYISNHLGAVRFPHPTMGTMEGTNFHVAAVRVKNNATSWSRRGAEAMVLIRCAILTGRNLVRPDKGALFTEAEKAAADAHVVTSASQVPMSIGKGYEMPHIGISIPKTANISVACRA